MILPELSRSMLKNSLVLGLFAVVTVGAVTLLQQFTAERIQASERAAQLSALTESLPRGSYDNQLLDSSIEVHDPLLGTRKPLAALGETLDEHVEPAPVTTHSRAGDAAARDELRIDEPQPAQKGQTP